MQYCGGNNGDWDYASKRLGKPGNTSHFPSLVLPVSVSTFIHLPSVLFSAKTTTGTAGALGELPAVLDAQL